MGDNTASRSSPSKTKIHSSSITHHSPHRFHPINSVSLSSSPHKHTSTTTLITGPKTNENDTSDNEDKRSVISELQPETEDWHETEKDRKERLAYEQFIKEEAEKAAREEVRNFLDTAIDCSLAQFYLVE